MRHLSESSLSRDIKLNRACFRTRRTVPVRTSNDWNWDTWKWESRMLNLSIKLLMVSPNRQGLWMQFDQVYSIEHVQLSKHLHYVHLPKLFIWKIGTWRFSLHKILFLTWMGILECKREKTYLDKSSFTEICSFSKTCNFFFGTIFLVGCDSDFSVSDNEENITFGSLLNFISIIIKYTYGKDMVSMIYRLY